METISLDFEAKEINLKIDGQVKKFTITEMDGINRDRWLQSQLGRTGDVNMEKKTASIKDVVGIHTNLISRCLKDESGNLVTETVISKWPQKAIKRLYDLCEEVNGLNEKGDEAAKKDSQPSSTSGS